MDTLLRMNFSGLSASTFTMAENDDVMASDQKLKKLKKKMNTLYKELRQYTESYRKFISSQQNFFAALDSLYEDNWIEKSDFRRSFEVLTNIGQNGAKNLETIPIEETIVFKDQFGPYEKEIKDYVEKTKHCRTADKKVQTYQKKKTTDADELRRLQNMAYEKATSVRIVQRRLQEELPRFYNSRMEFYSKLWRSVFQIHGDIAKAESETMSQLMSIVRDFDRHRSEGVYDCNTFVVSEADNLDDDDYAVEADPSSIGEATASSASLGGGAAACAGATAATGSLRSRRSSDDSFGAEYAVVQKPSQQQQQMQNHNSEFGISGQRLPPQKLPKPALVIEKHEEDSDDYK